MKPKTVCINENVPEILMAVLGNEYECM